MKPVDYLKEYGYKGELKEEILSHAKKGKIIALYHRFGAPEYDDFKTEEEAKDFLDRTSDYGEGCIIGIIDKDNVLKDYAGPFFEKE